MTMKTTRDEDDYDEYGDNDDHANDYDDGTAIHDDADDDKDGYDCDEMLTMIAMPIISMLTRTICISQIYLLYET